MTKQRTWPNNAAYARDMAIMEAMEALRELLPVIRGEKEFRFVLASVVDHLHRVVELLKEVS